MDVVAMSEDIHKYSGAAATIY